MLLVVMLSVVMLLVVMLSVVMLSDAMVSVVMLSVVMLSVVMLLVVMLSVVMLLVVMLSVVMVSDNLVSVLMSCSNNLVLGQFSAYSLTTGSLNVAMGYGAYSNQFLFGNTTGSGNVMIGSNAGTSYTGWTTGSDNIILGSGAGSNFIQTASNNIVIGKEANTFTLSGTTRSTGNNNIIIGNTIHLPSLAGSDQLNIGNLIYGNNINGTYGTLSTGNIGIGVNNPAYKLDVGGTFHTTGVNTLDNLAGSGTRMVVADASGVLSTQTISSGVGFEMNFLLMGA
jgi:hypothetical protein